MRYAIVGDIHSNLEAFEAVLASLAGETYDALVCPGDVVGYGASPRECVRMLRDLAPHVLVAGNHDWAVAGRLSLDYFNSHAREAILWTRTALSPDDVKFLGGLEPRRSVGEITLSHGTIHDPERFEYLQTPYDAHLSFAQLTTPYGVVGHSHVPVTFRSGTTITYLLGEEIFFAGSAQVLVNVGSVGQPRDEDPRAAYGLLDTVARSVEVRRVAYDVEASAARIRRVGLPDFLGDRLRIGR